MPVVSHDCRTFTLVEVCKELAKLSSSNGIIFRINVALSHGLRKENTISNCLSRVIERITKGLPKEQTELLSANKQ